MSTKRLSVKVNYTCNLKITIFAIPKAFNSHIEIIQRNAIQSWTKLNPTPEIILFGEEEGTKSIANELGLIHIPNVKTNDQKTPLLNDVFNQVQQVASSNILAYINSDIILPQNFISTIEQVIEKYKQFLMVGRRWNLDIQNRINFDNPQWEENLQNRLKENGIFSGVGALDYFVFPKPLFSQLPEFAVGRAGWDNWMITEALNNNYPVINASQVINIIHQNHDYKHLSGGRLEAFFGAEARKNLTFLKQTFRANSANATHYLIPESNNLVKVSIVITKDSNTEVEGLEKTIKSIEKQNINNLEVIIIDNGVTDKLEENFINKYTYIKYINLSKYDIIATLNKGLELAKGEFINFLSPGHLLPENTISEAIKSFEDKAGSLEFVLGGWQVIDNQNKVIQECQCWHILESILIGKEGLHGFHIWMLPTMGKLIQLSSCLFRRSWLLDCEGFDPDLSIQAATIDLLLKLSSKGASGFCLPKITSFIPKYTWATTQVLKRNKIDYQIILDKYFQRPILRKWMLPLKSEAEAIIKKVFL